MDRVEQLISEIEQYIDGCKTQAFSFGSNPKIIVDRSVLDDFLAELRLCIPDVIEHSAKILESKETILNDARNQAERMIKEASTEKTNLIDEHEIVQQAIEHGNNLVDAANQKAQEILNHAIREANAYRDSAFQYTLDSMNRLCSMYSGNLEGTRDFFNQYMEASQKFFDDYISKMDSEYKIIQANRDSLITPEPEQAQEE